MGRVQAPLVISVDLVQIGDRTNIPYAPKVSDGEKTDKKTEEIFKKEFFDSKGKFKISSISKLF